MMMKMKPLLFVVLMIGSFAFANDAYVRTAGGVVLPFAESKSPNISMAAEEISITMQDDHYHINVDFTFYNYGESETIKVGFPEWKYSQPTDDFISNFATTVNGKPVAFTCEKPSKPDALSEYMVIVNWYTREVEFPGKSITNTSVSYDAPYGVYGIEESVDYLFGTANSWKEPIGSLTLKVNNETDYWINSLQVGSLKNLVIETTDNGFILVEKNVTPQNDSRIEMVVSKLPDALVSLRYISFDRNWSLNKYLLTPGELRLYSKKQLRILRNVIFAGHGHIFKSQDINEWLQKYATEWYTPKRQVDISELNDIERKNIELIQQEEARR